MTSNNNEWSSDLVKNLVSTPVTDGPHMTPKFQSDGIPFLSVNNLVDGRIDFTNLRYISHKDHAIFSKKCLPRKGDVLLGKAASVGKVAIIENDIELNVWSPIAVLRFGDEIDSRFAYYQLQSEATKRQISLLTNTSSQGNIGMGDIERISISYPDLPEQKAIASALDKASQVVNQLDLLIKKKMAIKQGMMQHLLTGRTRLPGFTEAWSNEHFGDLGTFLKGYGIKRDDVRRIGVPCIRYGELYTAFHDYTRDAVSYVSPEVAATALPIRPGDVLFAGSGETREEIGKCVAYVGNSPAVAGGDTIVLRGSAFNPIFLASLANSPEIMNKKSRAGQGDAVVHISSRALAAIEITLPPRDEQDAIATVIVDVDQEIYQLQRRIHKAKAVKQGMMQELLTGRTRLPVLESVA